MEVSTIMNTLIKTTTVSLVALSLGAVALPIATLPAYAKTKAATVLPGIHILNKKTAYHIKSGYIYANTKLIKKVHKSPKYQKTNFYASQAVQIAKPNGKTATYYHIQNKRGTVKGWIWKGHLKKANAKSSSQYVTGHIYTS